MDSFSGRDRLPAYTSPVSTRSTHTCSRVESCGSIVLSLRFGAIHLLPVTCAQCPEPPQFFIRAQVGTFLVSAVFLVQILPVSRAIAGLHTGPRSGASTSGGHHIQPGRNLPDAVLDHVRYTFMFGVPFAERAVTLGAPKGLLTSFTTHTTQVIGPAALLVRRAPTADRF